MSKALELLKEWDKYLDTYDPYADGSVPQYGSGAIGIEVAGIKEKVKEIIKEAKREEKKNKKKGH